MEWTDAYAKIKTRMCSTDICDKKCTKELKIYCVEIFLMICEDLEISEALHEIRSDM
jgi:hypothetical protein